MKTPCFFYLSSPGGSDETNLKAEPRLGQISSANHESRRFLTEKRTCRNLQGMLRAIQPNGRFVRAESKEESTCEERHYSVNELAVLWNLSKQTIRRLFQDEPDVVRIGENDVRRKRAYVTLRIPESVARRVHQRLSKSA